jgi:hypothetical protein
MLLRVLRWLKSLLISPTSPTTLKRISPSNQILTSTEEEIFPPGNLLHTIHLVRTGAILTMETGTYPPIGSSLEHFCQAYASRPFYLCSSTTSLSHSHLPEYIRGDADNVICWSAATAYIRTPFSGLREIMMAPICMQTPPYLQSSPQHNPGPAP